jgi:ABC-type transport system involved in multi-copper enzyme maturation permease subunit
MVSRFHRFIRHVLILTQEELRDLILRKRAMMSLFAYVWVIGFVVLGLVYVEERLRPSIGFFRNEAGARNQALDWANENGFGELARIIGELGGWPSSVVISQVLFLLWFPTLVALVSCDMVAIDVYRGTLRFLLLRTSRLAYYFSKLLAHFLLYLMLYGITVVALIVVSAARDPLFSVALYARPMALNAMVLVAFLLFLVASTQFVSCWSAKPMNAVVRLHLLWIAFIGVLFIAPWASPFWSPISTGLVAPVFGHEWRTVLGMLVWTGISCVGGLTFFLRRAL